MKNVDSAARLCLVAIMTLVASGQCVVALQEEENRWESRIAEFEAADQDAPPPRKGILFVGSSSIRGWKLHDYFPGMPVINRGFGGSEIADSIHFADRIILSYEPKVVVVYAGDNDISRGKSAARVVEDFRTLVAKIQAKLPETRIVFIAIKPSIKRWKLVDTMRAANKSIQEMIEGDDRLRYVDIDTPMIGEDGKPREDLFVDDGLHLSKKGYQLWTSLVMPHLKFENE